ncbi:MAG: hypothetical protein EXR97_01675 [Nitrospiraceae bacterium]|nr:hypothetical protein [Nitrospiraceae bacterium]MSR24372.1 hypothetical protein [Nitrospiraceae bacterium]
MNVVESPFAAVRLRTTAGKRYKRVESATALIWKLPQVAERTFRRLNAPELLRASMLAHGMGMECNRTPSLERRSPPDSIYTPIDKTLRCVHTVPRPTVFDSPVSDGQQLRK